MWYTHFVTHLRRSMSRATEPRSFISFFIHKTRENFCTLQRGKNQVTFTDMCMNNEFVLMQYARVHWGRISSNSHWLIIQLGMSLIAVMRFSFKSGENVIFSLNFMDELCLFDAYNFQMNPRYTFLYNNPLFRLNCLWKFLLPRSCPAHICGL